MNSPTLEKWESLANDPLVSVRQIQSKFGFDVTTIRRWIKNKQLRAVKIGGQIRIRQSAILELMKDMGV